MLIVNRILLHIVSIISCLVISVTYLLPHRYTQIYLHLGVLGCYFTNAYFTPNYVTDSEKHSVPDILVELLP